MTAADTPTLEQALAAAFTAEITHRHGSTMNSYGMRALAKIAADEFAAHVAEVEERAAAHCEERDEALAEAADLRAKVRAVEALVDQWERGFPGEADAAYLLRAALDTEAVDR